MCSSDVLKPEPEVCLQLIQHLAATTHLFDLLCSPVKAPPRQTVPDATVAAPAAATAVLAPQMDALLRENQRLKAQVVLLQEEKHRIAKQVSGTGRMSVY